MERFEAGEAPSLGEAVRQLGGAALAASQEGLSKVVDLLAAPLETDIPRLQQAVEDDSHYYGIDPGPADHTVPEV